MTALNFETPSLYVEHKPDSTSEVDGNGVRQVHELPGHVYFGFVINGVKVPVGRKATAGLLADIKRAKAKQDAAEPVVAPDAPAS
jgi:hypothetical protein